MTELLAPAKPHRVLEIGTGSGYQAAILGQLASQVYTMDCVRAGKRAKGASAPGRISVSLGHITGRVRLGTAYLPAKYTEAASVGDRMDLMDAIDVLTSEELEAMLDAGTKAKIREFVLAEREAAAPVGWTAAETPPAEIERPSLEADSEVGASQGGRRTLSRQLVNAGRCASNRRSASSIRRSREAAWHYRCTGVREIDMNNIH